MIKKIIEEIQELNSLDGKSLPERIIKFNEEYGEFNAEVGKLIGITHKPYDRSHLVEESADFLQNTFSVLITTCDQTDITLDEIIKTVIEKNQKWRDKFPQYTRNEKSNNI